MSDSPMRLTPRRTSARRTRDRLLAAGRRAFAAKGLGGTNLREDILAPANVSPGSFYHQFEDKSALLLEILHVDGARILAHLESPEPAAGGDFFSTARAAFAAYFDMADKNPDFVKIYVREYYSDDKRIRKEIRDHNDKTIGNVARILERINETTHLEVDAELGGILVSSLTVSMVNYYLGLSPRQRSSIRERMIDGLTRLYLGGIGTVKAEL